MANLFAYTTTNTDLRIYIRKFNPYSLPRWGRDACFFKPYSLWWCWAVFLAYYAWYCHCPWEASPPVIKGSPYFNSLFFIRTHLILFGNGADSACWTNSRTEYAGMLAITNSWNQYRCPYPFNPCL